MDMTKIDTASLGGLDLGDIAAVSFVIPFLDESETLGTLVAEIEAVFKGSPLDLQIILVDDGSTDDSPRVARKLAHDRPAVELIRFRRNFGKAAALSAGFDAARGDVVFTMDADLQDDPNEIPRFLAQIAAGADLVTGWKKRRNDPIDKTLPSKVFNAITSRAFRMKIHDINCGFKAYRAEVLDHITLYGELHRFTPALANAAGFGVVEVEVAHRPREHGQSKYGWSRFIKGLVDLMTVMLLTRYGARPAHFFAKLGLPILALGTLCVGYLAVLWCLGMGPIGTRPLLQIGILLIITGIQLLGVGLIAELFSAARLRQDRPYVLAEHRREAGA